MSGCVGKPVPILLSTINAKWIHPSLALRLLKANPGDPENRCDILEFALRQPLAAAGAILAGVRTESPMPAVDSPGDEFLPAAETGSRMTLESDGTVTVEQSPVPETGYELCYIFLWKEKRREP